MSYIYLAAPYTHSSQAVMDARALAVTKVAAILMQYGQRSFSPITYGKSLSRFLPRKLIEDHDGWMSFDAGFLRQAGCLSVLALEGWEESAGLRGEVKLALALDIPVKLILFGSALSKLSGSLKLNAYKPYSPEYVLGSDCTVKTLQIAEDIPWWKHFPI